MKPLLISPSWPAESSTNGVVAHVAHLWTEFRRLGHRPVIATPDLRTDAANGPGSDDVFELVDGPIARFADHVRYRLSRETPVDCMVARRIRALVSSLHRQGRVDLIQMEEAWGTAAHLAGRLPVPVTVRLHGPWFLTGAADGVPQDAAFRRRVEMEGRAIASAAEISAPSAFVLNATREHYQLALDRADVIPNCVQPVPEEMQWTGEASDRPLILFVGRFDEIKGGDVVLKAFETVHARAREARLVFIGPDRGMRTPDGQWVHFPEFVSRNLSPQAAARVDYLGPQKSSVIEHWRRRASVTVIASRFDNFPNTALESLAHGSPTVATAVGGIPEIIRDEVTGLLVPSASPEAMAIAICRLLDDHSLAIRLGRAASADARHRFHPGRCAELMLASYSESLIARRNSA